MTFHAWASLSRWPHKLTNTLMGFLGLQCAVRSLKWHTIYCTILLLTVLHYIVLVCTFLFTYSIVLYCALLTNVLAKLVKHTSMMGSDLVHFGQSVDV
jgi:hypothetical protein